MNWLDWVLAIILVSSGIAGLKKGFARTVIGVVAVFVAIFLASWTYGLAGGLLTPFVTDKPIANLIGFLLVFSGVLIAGNIAGRILASLFKWVGLGWLDRLMGAGLGLARGVLVSIGLVLLLCAFATAPPPSSVVNSRLAPHLIDASSLLAALAPHELRMGFEQSYKKAKAMWEQMLRKVPSHVPEKVRV